ncbi:MAG: HAD family hydrolase [Candidatus Bathyarchaeota archaeon]|nr:HAD family hydrolase [Candidatus Bathyarchaeota archaeon]
MPIKAVLFDMFDTLMLIEKEHAFYGPALKQMYNYIVQNGVKVSFPAFRDAYIKARDELYEKADVNMEEPHFNLRVLNALQILGYSDECNIELASGATNAFCSEFMKYVRLDDDAPKMLRKLHGKYRLGIVSNFAIPECVIRLLQQHDLYKFFDVVIVSGAVNKRKPNPAIFTEALSKLGVKAAEAVFVGDTVDADVKGPKEVGMKTIYIDRRPQREIEENQPDHTIKRLSELPEAIKKC